MCHVCTYHDCFCNESKIYCLTTFLVTVTEVPIWETCVCVCGEGGVRGITPHTVLVKKVNRSKYYIVTATIQYR